MLPPMLAEVRQRILAKSANQRTARENALLDELDTLNQMFDTDQMRKVAGAKFAETRIVSGPSGTCSCCGR